MKFYLGTDNSSWLAKLGVPLFVSRRRLFARKRHQEARCGWALDSGAFSELKLHGGWQVPSKQYSEEVGRFSQEIGKLEWAAIQDWMCEPFMVACTGLTVLEHQRRTVQSYLDLKSQRPDLPFAPVLQGYTLADYLRCIDLYTKAGVDLLAQPVVGLGSICRRQKTIQIVQIVSALARTRIKLHGFGVKTAGLPKIGHLLRSADSMAWCYEGWQLMRKGLLPREQSNCAHCTWYALMWRDKCLKKLGGNELQSLSQESPQLVFDFESRKMSMPFSRIDEGFCKRSTRSSS